jgi:magnesium transporter
MIRTARGKNFAWYDVEHPNTDDVEQLRREVRIHPLVLRELIPQVRHPKLDHYGTHLFLVITIPILERDPDDPEYYEVRLEELDLAFGKTWLVSSHYRSIDVIDELFPKNEDGSNGGSVQLQYVDSSPASIVYAILSKILQNSITSLGIIEERLDLAEEAVFDGSERKMVRELSELRRDIIDFRRALSPSRPVFHALDDAGPAILEEGTRPYFRTLTSKIEQISTILKTLKETVEALEETNQSLLTTRTNDVMRVLTVFTTIMLPPTLVGTIFGMNVIPAEYSQNPMAFWALITAMTILITLPLAWFRKKRWL